MILSILRPAVTILLLVTTLRASAQDLDPMDVRVTLDQALPLAIAEARRSFPDLDTYLLYSVAPRVLKGDPKGLFWEFRWQEKAFPHDHALTVRVYLKDSSLISGRLEKGSYQKEHDVELKPNK